MKRVKSNLFSFVCCNITCHIPSLWHAAQFAALGIKMRHIHTAIGYRVSAYLVGI